MVDDSGCLLNRRIPHDEKLNLLHNVESSLPNGESAIAIYNQAIVMSFKKDSNELRNEIRKQLALATQHLAINIEKLQLFQTLVSGKSKTLDNNPDCELNNQIFVELYLNRAIIQSIYLALEELSEIRVGKMEPDIQYDASLLQEFIEDESIAEVLLCYCFIHCVSGFVGTVFKVYVMQLSVTGL